MTLEISNMFPKRKYSNNYKIFSISFLFLLHITLISCSETQNEKVPDFKLEGPIEISVPAEGMVQEYNVKTTGSWEIFRKSVETWAKISPAKGEKDGSFRIIFHENKSNNSRSMSFAVLLDGKELPDRITAVQAGAEVASWDETNQDEQLLNIKQGVPAYEGVNINYRRNGTPVLNVNLAEPVIVAVAKEPLGWGYFNFPNINKSITDNTLVINWSMAEDATSSYGKGGGDRRLSFDGGKTWVVDNRSVRAGGLVLPGGEMISIHTPVALDTNEVDLPERVALLRDGSTYNRNFSLYRHDDLPEVLQGVYINYWDKSGTYSKQHAVLEDNNKLLRYADGGLFPIVWWGDMKLLEDGSIVILPYPTFYEDEYGYVNPSGVTLYRSVNQGMNWTAKGIIPYKYDEKWDPNGPRRQTFGWTEPAFEILSDGTYLCVLRTTDGYGNSPMYISRSFDKGDTWTAAQAFTPSGVLPRLLQLDNGVLVLASGRPGIQLRFSFDGKGEEWTDPFELIPYSKDESSQAATCGYPRLLKTGPDRFMIVYSDFKYPTSTGDLRKAIKVREVVVSRNP